MPPGDHICFSIFVEGHIVAISAKFFYLILDIGFRGECV